MKQHKSHACNPDIKELQTFYGIRGYGYCYIQLADPFFTLAASRFKANGVGPYLAEGHTAACCQSPLSRIR